MPLSRDDQQRVADLQKAAAHLRSTGAEDLAGNVDYVLTPAGMAFVSRLRNERLRSLVEEGSVPPNLALEMPKELRDAIKRKAKAAGANLTAEAEHGLRLFLNGSFTPARPLRWARGHAPTKANLNVRVDRELRIAAEQLGKKLLADGELDWAPGITNLLTSYYADRVEEDFRNPVKKKDEPAEPAGSE